MSAEKAAGKRKRLPSEYAGLSKFDSEEFDLPSFNHYLSLLRQILAEENVMLAEYQRQIAASPPTPNQGLDVNALMQALSAKMATLP